MTQKRAAGISEPPFLFPGGLDQPGTVPASPLPFGRRLELGLQSGVALVVLGLNIGQRLFERRLIFLVENVLYGIDKGERGRGR